MCPSLNVDDADQRQRSAPRSPELRLLGGGGMVKVAGVAAPNRPAR